MIRAGIIGPTGYSGFCLLDLLLRHPEAEIVYLGGRREERPAISDIWPHLRGRLDMRCALFGTDPLPDMDVVFLCLPHTVAMEHVPGLLARNIRVIDVSADYRLKDPSVYTKWYKKEHTDPGNLAHAAYGLCECFREEIAPARLVANPGCYPTAVQLALIPLAARGLLAPRARIIVDAKSGVSGAGRDPAPHLHFPEANESVTAYKVGVHQHTGEMLQTIERFLGSTPDLLFVPHLIPMDRGILATCYAPLAAPTDTPVLKALYRSYYAGKPFIHVHMDDVLPNTKHVTGTNFVHIAVRGIGGTAVILSAIDNLIKGASGQAVQNMNILFDLDETTGLL